MTDIRIGISGWRYPPWRGTFYPEGLAQRLELEYAAHQFSSIELNGSFYSLLRPKDFANWRDATPRGFTFAVKGPRFVTHIRRLRDARLPLANFFASGVLELGEKLGPFLWQLPPNLSFDADVVGRFAALLPHDSDRAAALAREHDPRFRDRVSFGDGQVRVLRHALEVRHRSFESTAFVTLLRDHGIAAVIADSAGKWPTIEDLTADDFVYVRLHGDARLAASGYDDTSLDRWAERIEAWRAGRAAPGAAPLDAAAQAVRPRDVYCYFDNDAKVLSPANARSLMAKLGLPMAPTAAA